MVAQLVLRWYAALLSYECHQELTLLRRRSLGSSIVGPYLIIGGCCHRPADREQTVDYLATFHSEVRALDHPVDTSMQRT